jgi:hypothetical protein
MGDNMYAKLNVKAFALTCGILWAAFLFCITWWLILLEGASPNPTFFMRIYPGYSLTVVGSLIGLVWGFVDGLICGFIFAWLYNKLAKTQ